MIKMARNKRKKTKFEKIMSILTVFTVAIVFVSFLFFKAQLASVNIEVEKLITGRLGLQDVGYAMQQHIDGKAIKYLITP